MAEGSSDNKISDKKFFNTVPRSQRCGMRELLGRTWTNTRQRHDKSPGKKVQTSRSEASSTKTLVTCEHRLCYIFLLIVHLRYELGKTVYTI